MAGRDVTVQLKELLDEYDKEVRDAVEISCESVAKEAAKKLKAESPRKTGDYAKGWAAKKNGATDWVVYNRTEASKTHLLEYGHRTVNAKGEFGRTPAHPHIKPVEEWANEELQLRIERSLT